MSSTLALRYINNGCKIAIENIPPGGTYEVHETGWGEFEITIKMYIIPESLEKPQTLYHHLRLHPYGNTEAEKEAMKNAPEILSWNYEEIVFNEPYENFYEILTSPMDRSKGAKGGAGKGTRVMKGGMVGSVGERVALVPLTSRPGQPYSKETEINELRRLREAQGKVDEMIAELKKEVDEKEAERAKLKSQT
jgi:YEATS domain-containing protein 4